MTYNSDSVTERLINAITALGGPVPTSFGLGELLRAFDTALGNFGGGGATGDVTIVNGVSVLNATANVEAIIRNQSPNQLALLTGSLNANGNTITNLTNVGTVLAQTVYVPAATTKTTSSTTAAAVDTTNLTTPAFVATTTQVIVELTACAGIFGNGTGSYFWTVFEHGATTPLAVFVEVASAVTSLGLSEAVTAKLYVPGLTVGNTYQFDWAHAEYTGCTGVMVYGGATTNPLVANTQYGPAVMTVTVA